MKKESNPPPTFKKPPPPPVPPRHGGPSCSGLLCFYVLYEHGGVVSWRVTKTAHNLDTADGLISWIAEREAEKPEHADFFLKFWKRLEI